MDKKGLSGVIVALLLIGLAVVLIAAVWTPINKIVSENTDRTRECFGTFGELEINPRLTLYNSSKTDAEIQFSIDRGDVELDGILVVISSETHGETIEINEGTTDKTNSKLKNFAGSTLTNPEPPSKKGGKTYWYEWDKATLGDVKELEIAPKIGEEQCDVSDSFKDF